MKHRLSADRRGEGRTAGQPVEKKNRQRAREGGIVCYINQSKQTTHVLQLAPQDHASQHTAWHDMAWHGNPTEARGGNTG